MRKLYRVRLGAMELRPTRSTPRKILSYLDHSDPRMAKSKGMQFEGQERDLKDTADITSVGRVFKDGDSGPRTDPSLLILGSVMGLGAAAASLVCPAPLLLLTIPVGGAMLKGAYSQAKHMLEQRKHDQSNLNFKGSRTWQIEGHDEKVGNIDSPLLAEDSAAQPSRADFKEFVDSHLEADKNNVLVLHGHGFPGVQARIGRLPISDVSRVLKKKCRETGLKTGLMVLDSCQLGNLSVLKALEGTTDYLVASEADIDIAVQSDHRKSFNPFSSLARTADDNRDLAHRVVDEARGVSTLAAYDMTRLPGLFDGLDKLGKLLTEKNDRNAVKMMLAGALKDTKTSTQSANEPMVIDLGAFCERIKKESRNPETQQQAKVVLKEMDAVVTRKKSSGKFAESSHLSFHNPHRMHQRDRNELLPSRLPDGWKDFLRSQITQKSGF